MLSAPSSVNVHARPNLTHVPGPKGPVPASTPRDIAPKNQTVGGSHANMEAGARLIKRSLPNSGGITGVGGSLDATA